MAAVLLLCACGEGVDNLPASSRADGSIPDHDSRVGSSECPSIDCSDHDGLCVVGVSVCAPEGSKCITENRENGTHCGEPDLCTVTALCASGVCKRELLDYDGDGFPPAECADNPSLADCDDADFTVHVMAEENCDGKDNDCNGEVDEHLDFEPCYSGPPESLGVGQCRAGRFTCDSALGTVLCTDQVLPTAENFRDGLDNDCDGSADERQISCLDCEEPFPSPDELEPGVHSLMVTLMLPEDVPDSMEDRVADSLARQASAIDDLRRAARAEGFEFEVTRNYRALYAFACRADLQAIGRLLDHEEVTGLLKDFQVHQSLAESVPLIHADRVHDEVGITGLGVAVAVVDTGVDYRHAVFGRCNALGDGEGCRVIAGHDFVDDDPDPIDPSDVGHGTIIAGIIAGHGAEGCAAGVAPGADIVALRALDSTGSGYATDVMNALDWVIEHKQVHNIVAVNLGLATYEGFQPGAAECNDTIVARAIRDLGEAGVVVVAGSGNQGRHNEVSFPACATGTMSVGAVYAHENDEPTRFVIRDQPGLRETCAIPAVPDRLTCFSNGHTQVDLVAPGVSITSSVPGGSCVAKWGTSIAAAHVAGAIALLASELSVVHDGEISPKDVRDRLRLGGTTVTGYHRPIRTVPRLDTFEARKPLECVDRDHDTYGVGLRCLQPTDCDDDNSTVHPNAQERCGNQTDDDCNGMVDDCSLHVRGSFDRLVGTLRGQALAIRDAVFQTSALPQLLFRSQRYTVQGRFETTGTHQP